jgi:hypothetical protein
MFFKKIVIELTFFKIVIPTLNGVEGGSAVVCWARFPDPDRGKELRVEQSKLAAGGKEGLLAPPIFSEAGSA